MAEKIWRKISHGCGQERPFELPLQNQRACWSTSLKLLERDDDIGTQGLARTQKCVEVVEEKKVEEEEQWKVVQTYKNGMGK
jgi:hypothetical protein